MKSRIRELERSAQPLSCAPKVLRRFAEVFAKNYLIQTALLIASATFVACSGDDSIIEEPQQPEGTQTYTMTVQASKGGDGTRALSLDGKTLSATWAEGEMVEVYQSGLKIGELTAVASATASTTVSGTFASAPSTTADLTFYFHTAANPSYSGQDGTLETIASSYDFCAPATVTIGNFTVDNVNKKISVPSGISFETDLQSFVRFKLVDEGTINANNPDGTPINATRLIIHSSKQDEILLYSDFGSTSESGDLVITPESASSVIWAAISMLSGAPETLGASRRSEPAQEATYGDLILTASDGTDVYVCKKENISLKCGTFYDIPVSMTKVEAVDLGLPSGIKWASVNVNAATETDFGAYYSWGDTSEKTNYYWSDYIWCEKSDTTITKYNSDSRFGVVDNKTRLEASDDVAQVKWGCNWRMPTSDELTELLSNTDYEWVANYITGVNGAKFMKKSDHSVFIFLPAAGGVWKGGNNATPSTGLYWSSDKNNYNTAYYLTFTETGKSTGNGKKRPNGFPIRAVR